jgi:hypothetical protein
MRTSLDLKAAKLSGVLPSEAFWFTSAPPSTAAVMLSSVAPANAVHVASKLITMHVA